MHIQDFESIIEQIKPHLPEYLEEQGIDTSKHFLCISPDHNDSVPSANLVGNGTRVYCHGCSNSLDIFDAVQIFEKKTNVGIEWVEGTLKYLANKYGIEVQLANMTEEEIYKVDMYKAYRAASDIISVPKTKKNQAFEMEVKKRNWKKESLPGMGIGTVESYGDFRKQLSNQGFTQTFLNEIGLDKKDLFNQDCLIYTWYDEKGRPVGFVARDILFEDKTKKAKKKGETHKGGKYTNTRTTKISLFQKGKSLYGLFEALQHGSPLYIFEGQADVVTARMAGIHNVVAIGGSTLREDHIRLLKAAGAYSVVLCFDGDKTGKEKLEQVLEERFAGNRDLQVKIIELPDGEDPDSFIRKNGKKGFLSLAHWSGFEWKLNRYEDNADEIEICKEMVPYIVNEPSPIVRDQLVKTLSKRTGVTIQAINQELNILLDEKAHKHNRERQDILDEGMYQLRNSPTDAESILQKVQSRLMDLVKKHDKDSLSQEDFVRAIDEQKTNEEKAVISDGGFKLGPNLKDMEESFRGDWSEGIFMCIGGKANVGKSGFLCKLAYSIAKNNEDVVVIYHTIDDTAEQLLPRFVCIAEGSCNLSINMVRQPNYWNKTVGIQDVFTRRELGYQSIRKLAQDGRLVVKDVKHGCSIPFMENLICYYKDRYPERRIVFVLDNFHKLRDFDRKDERVRFKAMSEAVKNIALRHRCCIVSSIEYTKLAPGIKPTNHNIGECLTGDTQIFNPVNGSYKRIDEILSGDIVATLDSQCRVVPRKVQARLNKGIRKVWKVTTRTGRHIKATMNHPFFSEEGWAPLSDLQVGSWLAIPRQLCSESCSNPISNDLARFLGYMAGDGYYGKCQKESINSTPAFTNKDSFYIQDISNIVIHNFDVKIRDRLHNDSHHLSFARKKGFAQENPVVSFLKELGIHGETGSNKKIPEVIFKSSKEAKQNYIAGLFTTDGTVTGKRVKLTNKSSFLVYGTQSLLLSLGVQSSVNGPDNLGIYCLCVSNASIERFAYNIPLGSYKGERLQAILKNKQTTNSGDLLPPKFTSLVKKIMKKRNLPVRFENGFWIQKETINRTNAQYIVEQLDELREWAENDIFWDTIVEIEEMKEEQVWDLTVEDTHNFVANDIFCHNSGQIEYDASAIIHIYNEVADKPNEFTVCHEDKNWQGETQYLPRNEFIVGKNKISEVKKSFFLDFWPASSDFRSVDQKKVLEEAKEMKEKPIAQDNMMQMNAIAKDLENIYK